MNGEIEQLISLSSAANGVVAGGIEPSDYYPGNSSFGFCNAVTFVDLERGPSGAYREIERHPSPVEWLDSLKRAAGCSVWLGYGATNRPDVQDHMLAGFTGGGGSWSLMVAADNLTERWIGRWEVTDAEASDRRSWKVTYGCTDRVEGPVPRPDVHLDATVDRLRRVLQDIHAFSASHDQEGWADIFQKALMSLDTTTKPRLPGKMKLVCFDRYPELARRLLGAAYTAWVFGGMGSWNDLYFEEERVFKLYQTLSAELYAAVCEALQVASTSFER